MKASCIITTSLCVLLFGHMINCYSPLERRNFLGGEINQGMRTTPRPTPRPTPIPHLLASPPLPLWSVLNEREIPDLENLSKEVTVEGDMGTIDGTDFYDEMEALKDKETDSKEYKDLSEELKEKIDLSDEKNDAKRYFSSLGGSYVHGKRDEIPDKRYFDSLGGSHVFKRSSDFMKSIPDDFKRAPLDSLGGWQIHGYKRGFDTLGGTNLHSDFKRFISSLGGDNIHGYKRGFDTLGGAYLHNGYKRFMSSLGGGNIHGGFKRRLDTLGGANLHSGYKRYFSSLGGSNVHGYKRALSQLGGANVHSGYKREANQYAEDDMFMDSATPAKRRFDSIGGFNVHRYKRSRVNKQDSNTDQAAVKTQ